MFRKQKKKHKKFLVHIEKQHYKSDVYNCFGNYHGKQLQRSMVLQKLQFNLQYY